MAQDIGLLLRGLGAAFSNTVPQFRDQMLQEEENAYIRSGRERESQMQRAEMTQARQRAMYQDAESALKLLAAGDLDSVISLGRERIELLKNFPDADPSDTVRITQLAQLSRAGDRNAYQSLQRELLGAVNRGMAMGYITPPQVEEKVYRPGDVVFRGGQQAFAIPEKAEQERGVVVGRNVVDPITGRLIYEAPPEVENQETWQEASDLRKEFSGIPAVRQFAEQSSAFGRIEASASNPSAAGDLALIFNYMKVLDPGSTVREGEFANAQNAAGIPERIRALYNNATQGTRLTESQRSDFLSRARNLYENAERSYMRTYNQYKDIAERRNLPISDALIDYRYQSSMQFPQFFSSQEEADRANLPSGSIFEIPNPDDPDEILRVEVR